MDQIIKSVEQKKNLAEYRSKLVFGSALLSLIATLALYVIRFGPYASDSQEVWGQFGDYLGGVLNPILAFLSLLAILYTLRMQAEELAETRQEAAASRALVDKQLQTMRQQKFETTFFHLLERLSEIVASIEVGQLRGRAATAFFERHLMDHLEQPPVIAEPGPRLKRAYDALWNIARNDLGTYFRFLYNVVKFVDQSDHHFGKQREYVNFIRAQMCESEQKLLMFNGLAEYGQLKFKPLIEKYGMLEGIEPGGYAGAYRSFYEDGAFGEPDD